jgi:hypothetical protein
MNPRPPRANIDSLKRQHMDSLSTVTRGFFPAAYSPEKFAEQSDPFDNEVATRRNRDTDAWIKERKHATANNLSPERAITLQRHLALMHEMDDAIVGKQSHFTHLVIHKSGLVTSHRAAGINRPL